MRAASRIWEQCCEAVSRPAADGWPEAAADVGPAACLRELGSIEASRSSAGRCSSRVARSHAGLRLGPGQRHCLVCGRLWLSLSYPAPPSPPLSPFPAAPQPIHPGGGAPERPVSWAATCPGCSRCLAGPRAQLPAWLPAELALLRRCPPQPGHGRLRLHGALRDFQGSGPVLSRPCAEAQVDVDAAWAAAAGDVAWRSLSGPTNPVSPAYLRCLTPNTAPLLSL